MRNVVLRAAIARIVFTAALVGAGTVHAQDAASLATHYAGLAKQESAAFAGFSAARGKAFFDSTHGHEWSCASCHTPNPLVAGRHARTDKEIAPMAPAANPQRFTNLDKSEKWFKRNCNDVVGRACTAGEKGDVLAYLVSLKR